MTWVLAALVLMLGVLVIRLWRKVNDLEVQADADRACSLSVAASADISRRIESTSARLTEAQLRLATQEEALRLYIEATDTTINRHRAAFVEWENHAGPTLSIITERLEACERNAEQAVATADTTRAALGWSLKAMSADVLGVGSNGRA